jgi:drug/metabolite transporter, DME family
MSRARVSQRKSLVSLGPGAVELLAGYGLVTLGAGLWGALGLFYHVVIGGYGLTPLEAVFWRALLASLCLIGWLAWRDPDILRIERRHISFFIVFGLIGVSATFAIYAYAIRMVGMGVAAVLQYTAPAWVALFSVLVWKESLGRKQVAALGLALVGTTLVGRAYDLDAARLNVMGIAAALASGVTYAAYVLFIKSATRRGYTARTVLVYALATGTLFLLPLQSSRSVEMIVAAPGLLLWLMGLGVVTMAAGLAFNAGVKRVSASSASIVATIEPVTAMLLGWAVLGESLEGLQLLGACCVLGAVLMLQGRRKRSGA